jgi:hypothetical protein
MDEGKFCPQADRKECNICVSFFVFGRQREKSLLKPSGEAASLIG